MNLIWLWFCQWRWDRTLNAIDLWERRTAAATRRVHALIKRRS
jgi:hypothetical protein